VHPQPKRRTTHAYGTPKNILVYDRWGDYGRPVVLLHGLLVDRTMWWPTASAPRERTTSNNSPTIWRC
jgi:pimeloyl-ACP methyl ester carboxylesterase